MKKTLRKALSEYVALRRALGYKILRQGKLLASFVRFAEAEGAAMITTNLAMRWAQLPRNVAPSTWATRLGLIRRFAQHCRVSMRGTEVPSEGLLPHRYRRKPPYIYGDAEIWRMLREARRLSSRNDLRPLTYETLVGLLACTGMRIGEAIGLDDVDVDLSSGVLTVRDAKFGKDRFLPLHPSAVRALRRYRIRRNRCLPLRQSPSFIVSDSGQRPSYSGIRGTFQRILRLSGLDTQRTRRRPRIHDLRHTFAVKTLVRWYRSGVDVEARLPHLSTYLGHAHVTDTYWYLSSVPELLQCALRRLETRQWR